MPRHPMPGSAPKLPAVLTHRELGLVQAALDREPCFRCGSRVPIAPDAWHQQPVILEVCTGELAKDGLTSMALLGRSHYESASLTGRERFRAQGLEGKVRIRKSLFGAFINLRDLIAEGQGRIVVREHGVAQAEAAQAQAEDAADEVAALGLD